MSALESAPEHPALNAFAAFILDRLGERIAAIHHARTAATAAIDAPRPVAQAANLLARFRLFDEALSAANRISLDDVRDPVVADQLGSAFTACGSHEKAERAYARLTQLVPQDPRCRFNLAAAQRFNGERHAAAGNFDHVLKQMPLNGEAWYARALVQRATPDDNRISQLQYILEDPRLSPDNAAAVCYALGKELEDLGQWPQAFNAWSRGAAVMRQSRPYRLQPALDAITETVTSWPRARHKPRKADLTPVFIVSLPRAGSTLLDRILSSHPAIVSAGETEDFIVSLLEDTALAGTADPVELARRSSGADLAVVGQRYREALAMRGYKSGHVIDKTPTNFLYAGLIAEALPEARIIHLDRAPMDAALATFKTLFRDRYLWSYDLDDIAAYLTAKRHLMDHWEVGWPAHIFRTSYEKLIQETEANARNIVEFLDLDWDSACLDFSDNTAPVSTASADQVRQPIHDRSIGHWRHFEDELAQVANRLAAEGLL
ncbi:tetratricopeptide repeat-containing sulfotransferase family protein [Hyphobacterium sp.]|uniref:tetratricopeptide repeat-containing sulfotransferase family protein n=1 Tax=Hyphobacterium sp. TaxID=2004662 RepID=UPI003BA9494F